MLNEINGIVKFKVSCLIIKSSIMRFYLFAFLLSVFFLPAMAQKKVYDLVKDFGAKADNKTDCYGAFMKAAKTLSDAGGGTLNIPTGKYYIGVYKIIGGDKANNIADIVFKNCNGLKIIGNKSVIRINGDFVRKNDYKVSGLSFGYSYQHSVCPFYFTNCKNLLVKDVEINGEVLKMRREKGVVEGSCYGVVLDDYEETDVSNNIQFINLSTHHLAADGILIRANGENILVDKCNSYNNGRQGLSIVKGKKIRILNSNFDSTGITGQYGWDNPSAGIDIENEFGKGKLRDVLIRNCQLRGNKGFQIVTTLPSENVWIDSCFFSDLTKGYSIGENGIGMYSLNSKLTNSIIFGSIQIDLSDQIYTGEYKQELKNNIIYSGARGMISADYARPIDITKNILVMLPKPDITTYFPYIQNYNCVFNDNIIVFHADRIKKEPNQVNGLVQSVKEVKNNYYLINGFDAKFKENKSDYYYVAINGSKLVGKQIYPINDRIKNLNNPIHFFLTDKQLNQILSKKIFTWYNQTAYSTEVMKQVNEVLSFTGTIAASKK